MGAKTLTVCIAALALVAFVSANDRGNQNNKAGTCPVAGAGRCTKECEHDSGCTGVKKCCRTSCGGSYCHVPGQAAPTVAPAPQRGQTRPGYCVPSINQLICDTKCNKDTDCSQRNYKCCSTTCGGKVCSEPMTSPPATPPPTRPPSSNAPKPGQCKSDLAQFSCTSECQNDSDCRYDLKCCRTTCGGRMCSAPLHTHATTTTTTRRPAGSNRPGDCPNISPRANVAQGCPETCRRDNDCRPSNFKCCQNTCGGRDCVAPAINQG